MVRLVTVPELIGTHQVDLMKMDIEGAEDMVITENASWLAQVRVIVSELHPHYANTERIVETLRQAGFEYHRLPPDPNIVPGPAYMAVFSRTTPGDSAVGWARK
jgi:Methyltransferase FkbM domain